MNEKQKTRPAACTTEREVAEMTACRASIPISNYNTTAADRQLKISDLLSTGQENALPLSYLIMTTGQDGRTIRRMIAEERFAGVPILADNKTGYYMPANEDERRRCVRSMRHRAKEIDRAAQAIDAARIPRDYRKPAQRVQESTIGQMRMEGV